jgi:site-specific DNA-methyltransferase (adenine-specific)
MTTFWTGTHASSATDDWATPQAYFDNVAKYNTFTLDACADTHNRKAALYYGLDHSDAARRDGLAGDWAGDAGLGAVWMNPPYGRGIGVWMHKAAAESDRGATVFCLVPARTDTMWFQDTALARQELGRATVTFIRGRLRFGGQKKDAPFPSALVVFYPAVIS